MNMLDFIKNVAVKGFPTRNLKINELIGKYWEEKINYYIEEYGDRGAWIGPLTEEQIKAARNMGEQHDAFFQLFNQYISPSWELTQVKSYQLNISPEDGENLKSVDVSSWLKLQRFKPTDFQMCHDLWPILQPLFKKITKERVVKETIYEL